MYGILDVFVLVSFCFQFDSYSTVRSKTLDWSKIAQHLDPETLIEGTLPILGTISVCKDSAVNYFLPTNTTIAVNLRHDSRTYR